MAKEKVENNVQVDGSAVHTNPLAEAKGDLQKQIDALKHKRDMEQSGAPERTPAEELLAQGEIAAALNPEHRVRWISQMDNRVALKRQNQGYEIIPESEGGKSLRGDVVLARIPKRRYEEQVRKNEELHRARMGDGGKAILLRELEKTARELRDKHGIRDASVERLLNES